MANELGIQGLGDFLEWPPSRYLPEGFYSDAGKTSFRRDLMGMYAIKSAFRFRYEGITIELARDYVAELQKAATSKPADGPALQAAMEALAKRLLQEPFVKRLFLYDFFSECAAFLKDAKDFEALAKHVEYIVDRLALVEALAMADAENVPTPEG